ncbi:serine/threonine-protein kinase [Aspergillus stella-maris]|uniref:serine/threonine-protein kinase n=1 Tax=Aspergillus stella-maris TaxID=1810926 RepID=UPI003CCCD459
MGSTSQGLGGELSKTVRDSEIHGTYFPPNRPDETVHIYHDQHVRMRTARTECWAKRRTIASGGGGEVFLEERIEPPPKGQGKPTFRAVKRIDLRRGATHLDIARELEAIAKFSQRKYRTYGCFVHSDGWYRTSEYLFIAMEYLEFGDLHSYLYRTEQPPLLEHAVGDIVHQILFGLSAMHDIKLFHRDLKLKNILIHSQPPDHWRIKLADFGLSKRVEETLDIKTSAKGTLGYMAPELLGFSDRGPSYAIDIWAVGEITFQLLTKRPAFRLPGAFLKYRDDRIGFPLKLLAAANLSSAATDFIMRLMAFEPERRDTAKDALEHAWLQQTHAVPAREGPVQQIPTSLFAELATLDDDYGTWNAPNSQYTIIEPRKRHEASDESLTRHHLPNIAFVEDFDSDSEYRNTLTDDFGSWNATNSSTTPFESRRPEEPLPSSIEGSPTIVEDIEPYSEHPDTRTNFYRAWEALEASLTTNRYKEHENVPRKSRSRRRAPPPSSLEEIEPYIAPPTMKKTANDEHGNSPLPPRPDTFSRIYHFPSTHTNHEEKSGRAAPTKAPMRQRLANGDSKIPIDTLSLRSKPRRFPITKSKTPSTTSLFTSSPTKDRYTGSPVAREIAPDASYDYHISALSESSPFTLHPIIEDTDYPNESSSRTDLYTTEDLGTPRPFDPLAPGPHRRINEWTYPVLNVHSEHKQPTIPRIVSSSSSGDESKRKIPGQVRRFRDLAQIVRSKSHLDP